MNQWLAIAFTLLMGILQSKGQALSSQEGLLIANKLFEREILTKEGRDLLARRIKNNRVVDEHFQFDGLSEGVSKQAILLFCFWAFTSEFMYRSGTLNGKRQMRKDALIMEKASKKFEGNPAAFEQWLEAYDRKQDKLVEKRWRKRLRIEDRIQGQDSISNELIAIPMASFLSEAAGKLVPQTRSTFGKTRTRTAKDLLEIGLIDERIFSDILSDRTISVEHLVFHVAVTRSIYYDTYPQAKADQLKFLDLLATHGVLSPDSLDTLINSYGEFQLYTDIEILQHCNTTIVLDTSGYLEPLKYYKGLLNKVKTILPAFEFSDVEIKFDLRRDLYLTHQILTLSFTSGNQKYYYKFPYRVHMDSLVSSYDEYSLRADFYPILNKWLVDRQSDYRIYKSVGDRSYQHDRGDRRVALISLTEAQRNLWPEEDFVLTVETHNKIFSSDHIDRTISSLDSLGLFSHLTQQEKDSAQLELKQQMVYSYNDILMCFPKVVNLLYQETGDAQHPYVGFCQRLAAISRNNFRPANVHVDSAVNFQSASQSTIFSFELNGKQYYAELASGDDGLNGELVDLINRSLRENNIAGTFYYSYSGEEEAGYVFLDQRQHQFIEENYPGLLNPSR